MLTNRIRVLIQRVRLAGRKPKNILMPVAFRDMLREENKFQAIYHTHDKGDKIAGIPIIVDNSLKDILVQLEDERLL